MLEFSIEGRIPYLVMDYALDGTLCKLHPKGIILVLATIVGSSYQFWGDAADELWPGCSYPQFIE